MTRQRRLADPSISPRPADVVGYRGKRAADAAIAASLLLVLLPVLLVLTALVRATSPGPGFFRQERLGLGGRPFVMHKLRTMHDGVSDEIHRGYVLAQIAAGPSAVACAGLHKIQDDPRVTPLGRWLRRTSLDELPQLWDVFLGRMSLVGPRPILPWEGEVLTAAERERFRVRPGITGLWQVSGRSRLTMPQAFQLDAQYVRQISAVTDLRILLKTVVVVCHSRGSAC